jgi:hypothetical protein
LKKKNDRYICVALEIIVILAAHELGIKEVPVKIITSEVPKDLMVATEDYIPTEAEGYPPRRKAYEASQK